MRKHSVPAQMYYIRTFMHTRICIYIYIYIYIYIFMYNHLLHCMYLELANEKLVATESWCGLPLCCIPPNLLLLAVVSWSVDTFVIDVASCICMCMYTQTHKYRYMSMHAWMHPCPCKNEMQPKTEYAYLLVEKVCMYCRQAWSVLRMNASQACCLRRRPENSVLIILQTYAHAIANQTTATANHSNKTYALLWQKFMDRSNLSNPCFPSGTFYAFHVWVIVSTQRRSLRGSHYMYLLKQPLR
jgi:hypothetical protein